MPRAPKQQSPAATALRFSLVFATLSVWFMPAGCRPLEWRPPNQFSDVSERAPMPNPFAAPNDATVSYMPMIKVRLIMIKVPVGTASDSEELWSCLNEEAVDLSRSGDLGANGFRIGLAPREGWGELSGLLKRMTGRRHVEHLLRSVPGNPLHITIKQHQPIQTVFLFHHDRTLSGSDYPPGDNLLTIVCTFDEDDPNRVIVAGCPQIRSTRRTSYIVRRRGKVTRAFRRVLFPFLPLAFRLTIQSGDLIVIGPGPGALRPSSVGHHFLVDNNGGIEFETVLVLIPEIEFAPVKHVPARAPVRGGA